MRGVRRELTMRGCRCRGGKLLLLRGRRITRSLLGGGGEKSNVLVGICGRGGVGSLGGIARVAGFGFIHYMEVWSFVVCAIEKN